MYSGHDLIPHLNVLQNLYTRRVDDDDDAFRTTYYDLERLPQALGAAWYSLKELARLQTAFSEEVPESKFDDAQIVGLSPTARNAMTFAVDSFLDACRRAQDALIPYLTRGLQRSLPASLHVLIKGLRSGKHELPENLQRNLLKYWHEHGSRLKDYRDIVHHHALITSDARLFRMPSGKRFMYFVLPSNPEAASASRLRFGDPPVHAYPYALDEFFALVIITSWVTEGLVPEGFNGRMSVVVFRDELTTHQAGSEVPSEASFSDQIQRLRAKLGLPGD